MDEERRTSVNLKNCIALLKTVPSSLTQASYRTGDEIHTFMEAYPFVRKGEIKGQIWFPAYENRNVMIGLQAGLRGKAQIGKGMWPKPDMLLDMYKTKTEHPEAGASCAWVPSPTGAVIHAIHYHQINVANRQKELLATEALPLDDLLTPPLAKDTNWTEEESSKSLKITVKVF